MSQFYQIIHCGTLFSENSPCFRLVLAIQEEANPKKILPPPPSGLNPEYASGGAKRLFRVKCLPGNFHTAFV